MATTILTVNTTADQNDGSAANGLSLRDAIIIANANPNTDYEIQLTGGSTYNLTSNGINEDNTLTGDLDIKTRNNVLYIVAVGGQKATIDASNLLNSDRVFDVLTGGELSLQNLVVKGGAISGKNGGGIQVASTGFLDLYNTTVSNNSAENGGGLYNAGDTHLRNGSTVSNNSVSGTVPSGGGINNAGTLTVIDSTISNNNGATFGGGIYNSKTLTLINTTVSSNTAKTGGGINNNFSNASAALVNTTVSGNSASLGGAGGISNDGGIINLLNSTVTNNTFSGILGYAGGVSNRSGTVNLKNTIVAGNLSLDGRLQLYPDLSGTFNGNNYNLIGSLTGASGTVGTGTDIVNPNPGLGPLQNNGGLTLTHALLSGSPAINAGDSNLIPADTQDLDGDGDKTEPTPYDQRGLARVSGGTVDIGALELQAATLPTLSINDISVTEGNTGTTNATFTVTLSAATTSAVTVNYATANNTATAGSDYTATTGTLTFNAGETSKTFTVAVTGDTTTEANETFFVNLTNATNATITDNQAVGTITNDDTSTVPTLSINEITVVEGQTPQAVLTVTLSSASSQPVTVKYTTAAGTATANTDYTSRSGTLTFAANTTTATITVPILNDNLNEANETFKINLSSPTNATLLKATGTVTIADTLQASTTTTLADGIENLTLIGTSNINGTGNSGNNILTGNSGNNILAGGNGNDTYAFNASTPLGSDRIQEITTGGNDTLSFSGTSAAVRVNLGIITTQTVNSNLKLTLSANNVIENVVGGNGSDRLIGNTLNNTLNGGSGNDVLTGGGGADTLIGGSGNDILTGGADSDRFSYSSGKAFTSSDFGNDTLTDFTSASDKLVLSKKTFTALSSIVGDGLSQVSDFTTVEDDDLAATSSAYLVYSISSGSLYYNQNGVAAGLGSGAEFANFLNIPSLTAADFAIVA